MIKSPSGTVVALGANLSLRGNGPADTLRQALSAMSEAGLVIRAQSRFFATPCFPEGAGPDYVNAAALIETDLSATGILTVLHDIEQTFGRARAQRWGMRTLDLDLVCCGELVLPDVQEYRRWQTLPIEQQVKVAPDQLILPHPRLQDRAFVLVPMADVAKDWLHPELNKTVREMIRDLPAEDIAAVTPL